MRKTITVVLGLLAVISCQGGQVTELKKPVTVIKPPLAPSLAFENVPAKLLLSNALPLVTLRARNSQSCAISTSPKISKGDSGYVDFKLTLAADTVAGTGSNPSSVQAYAIRGRAANTMPADSARIYLIAECNGQAGSTPVRDSIRIALDTSPMCVGVSLSPNVWSLKTNGQNGGFIHILCPSDTFTVANRSWYFGTQAGGFLDVRMPATVWISPQEVMIGLGLGNPQVGTVVPVCVMNPGAWTLPDVGSWCGRITIGM